jgi:hypothetical protein
MVRGGFLMKRRVSCSAFCLVLITTVVFPHIDASAQRGHTHGGTQVICDYDGSRRGVSRGLRFGSVAEAEAAVDRILKVAGLTRNFVIEASYDVDNAESGVDGNNRRYIYYNPAFMERIRNMARTDWAALAIMAHEIGHHLLGHRIEDEGRTPQEEEELRHRQELEADKYTGFILRYMGASVEEAQSAVRAYGEEGGSPTHPGKKARLDAIRVGWEDASDIIKGLVTAQEGRSAPPPQQPSPAPRPTTSTPPQTSAPRQSSAGTATEVPQISAHNTSSRLSERWWGWTVFIDAPPQVLEQVGCVVYQLHPTFRPSMVRVCNRGDGRPFALKAQGWGTFDIQIRVLMKDGRQYDLSHELRL